MKGVSEVRREAAKKLKRWRDDPVVFVQECFGVNPDPWQVDVLREFPTARRQAEKACKGPGKTACLSWRAWNFLVTRLHPKVAATSISKANLADGLWTEMAKWQARSEFLKQAFVWTKTRIHSRDHPETWFMSARSWTKGGADNQQANTLAGLHADNMLFILDEAGGIPDAVMAAAEAGLANDFGAGTHDAKILMSGNPTHLEGPLYRACTSERHLWQVTEITSDPDDLKRTPRVSADWAREQIEKYGRENPWVLVNVFGKFPPSSVNALLGPDEIEDAMKRTVPPDAYQWSQKRLGVDVARFGDDRTVLFPRQGLVAFDPVVMRHDAAKDNPSVDIANRVMRAKMSWEHEMEIFDDTGGWAKGAVDILRSVGHTLIPVQFHGKPMDPRYLNMRAEMWFGMAEWIKRGGCLPNVPELKRELTAPTYTFVNGKFQLEPKDMIKARIGVSPDLADALCLTFALPEMPGEIRVPGVEFKKERLKSDWDPYADDRE